MPVSFNVAQAAFKEGDFSDKKYVENHSLHINAD